MQKSQKNVIFYSWETEEDTHMTLKQLKYFQKSAETGSFTKAAEQLYISQPALSLALQELERELEVPLFEKIGRTMVLTKYGKTLYEHTIAVFNELQSVQDELKKMSQPDYGQVIISHISSMSPEYIPTLIQEFYDSIGNQNIRFGFLEGPSRIVEQNVLQKRGDIGFGSKPLDPSLTYLPLYDEELVVIVPPNNPLSHKDTVHLQETASYPFIAYDKSCGISTDIDQLYQSFDIKRDIACAVLDNIMVAALVSTGMGVAVVPKAYAKEIFGVHCLHIIDCNPVRTLYAYWLESASSSPAELKFREFIQKRAKAQYHGVMCDLAKPDFTNQM